ncbi:hypothetical protein ACKKBG_A18790 [Auxenochlorella protothecoides x Auxenochlorella symbiontica]
MALRVERRLEGGGKDSKLILTFRGPSVRRVFSAGPAQATSSGVETTVPSAAWHASPVSSDSTHMDKSASLADLEPGRGLDGPGPTTPPERWSEPHLAAHTPPSPPVFGPSDTELQPLGPGARPLAMQQTGVASKPGLPPAVAGLGSGGLPHGTLVWAKLPTFPWWPAQVQMPTPAQARSRQANAAEVFVVFYGTADYSWVPTKDCALFGTSHPHYTRYASTRHKGLQRAVDEAWAALGQPRPDVAGKPRGG